ncbi:cytochrome d ubiquinol oxidase subunit II [Salinibacterium sp. ZJ450]|uniref:cytochrome d ubiquinol oxidase subunit II n=1 Tax=Salinibacterium sp. ZJ450 TaxID=2708338 RepID=UPI00141E1CB8|nr:cytochrome d ubiquinol oxidase subunit II [Salinibacterium sp. ZJ450]
MTDHAVITTGVGQSAKPSDERAGKRLRLPAMTGSVLSVLAVAAAIAVHVIAAIGSSAPIYAQDEIGYIANAQVLSGIGDAPSLSGLGYYVGWSLLLVPFWWIFGDPQSVYLGAVALSAFFGIFMVVPVALLARQLSVAYPWALVIGAIVSVAPSRVMMSNFAFAENFLAVLVVLFVLQSIRFAARASVLNACLLGLVAGSIFVTHMRMAPFLVVTAVWFAFRIRRSLMPSLAGLAALTVTAIPGYLLFRYVLSVLHSSSVTREGRGLNRLFTTHPVDLLTAASGQAWYATVSLYGLVTIGVLVLVVGTAEELRRRSIGANTVTSIAAIGVLAISVIWIGGALPNVLGRLDLYTYGRYLDPLFSVVVALALIALFKGQSRRSAFTAASLSVAAVFVFLVAILLVVSDRMGNAQSIWWVPVSVSGLLHWDWPNVTAATIAPWLTASAAGLLGVAAVLLLRRRAKWLLVATLVTLLVTSVVADQKTMNEYTAPWYKSFTLRHVVNEYPAQLISFDKAGASGAEGGGDTVSANMYQFWTSPEPIITFNSTEQSPPTELVISRFNWALADELGARRVAIDGGMFDNVLWVLPGVLQDELASQGRLLAAVVGETQP